MRSARPLLALAALALFVGAASAATKFDECQAPPKGQVRAGKGATVAAVTGAELVRTYVCGKDGYSAVTTFFDNVDPKAEGAKPIGRLTNVKDQVDRQVEWFEPGQPDKITGRLTVLQDDTTVESTPTNCTAEPNNLRRAVKGEGAGEGIAYVIKRDTQGESEPDCTGKRDGDEVELTYTAQYIWYGCSNDPFKDPAPAGPIDPDTLDECEAPAPGSIRPGAGTTVMDVLGADIVRTFVCGKEGHSSVVTFHDPADPSITLGGLKLKSSKDNERVAEFHAPNNPDEPTGSVVFLEDTSVEDPDSLCRFVEPSSLRQAVQGDGIARGAQFVVKGGIQGDVEPDCAGKKDGEEVKVKHTATFTLYGCASSPFADN